MVYTALQSACLGFLLLPASALVPSLSLCSPLGQPHKLFLPPGPLPFAGKAVILPVFLFTHLSVISVRGTEQLAFPRADPELSRPPEGVLHAGTVMPALSELVRHRVHSWKIIYEGRGGLCWSWVTAQGSDGGGLTVLDVVSGQCALETASLASSRICLWPLSPCSS